MNLPIEASLVPYHKHGVAFHYPEIWELDEAETDDGIVVTVTSDGTCFWSLHILSACPPPPQVVESGIAAFEDEYEDAETTEIKTQMAEMPAFSREVEFSCYELMNTASLHSVRTSDFTLLVLWQGTDHELEEHRRVFELMTATIQADSLQGSS